MLLDDILADIKIAMKARESNKLAALRTLHSDIKNVGINTGNDINDEIVIDVISKSIKQKKDAIEQFRQGQREDLVQEEEERMVYYQKYLPQQLSEDEISQLIQDAISETGAESPRDMGKVMKIISAQIKGKADGKVVSQMVQAQLKA